MNYESQLSLQRLLPRLRQRFADASATDWADFEERLYRHFERLFLALLDLYGGRYDFFFHLEDILATAAESWLARPQALKLLDDEREQNPTWFQSQGMVGGVCYVDLFADNLAGIRQRIPYFQELGLTYLHLMPLFASPEAENDGGYAVSSYREVEARLGTMAELEDLTAELRGNGISLVIDFVFNHTSDEHEWAQRAIAGEREFEEMYFLFPDRTQPDAYDAHLREIFPDVRPGSFTYRADIDRWVWTTFNSFQWDLNYRNPAVFKRMATEMLFLANVGVEILRLDAVAFTWKELGTNCENLPLAHVLIQAFNALARIAAPALLFKSEAIVHPDEVAKYIDPEECQLSYNPLLMALLWEALATRNVRLLAHSLRERFRIDPACAWVNYVRCHDDIGWTFDDGDARRLDINGFDHRHFLNDFYTGRFQGSFARGLPFQENPATGDARISGACASLAGLEKALRQESDYEVELAVKRILLIHSVILSIGGIPLIYLGDEVGTTNDYSFRDDPAKAGDSRWLHRPRTDWARADQRHDVETVSGKVFQGLQRLMQIRQDCATFSGNEMTVINPDNEHVFAYLRQNEAGRVLIFTNFSEQPQHISGAVLRTYGLGYEFTDLISERAVVADEDVALAPYEVLWLAAR
ncbi:MAG: alpha-glucosidase C-terminal domain-containing protein [Caldilineales bacterium]|nr:alpha-glucosidase C-terminal domain-containing protein [Caldilineales bacterium]